jgi:hypothetical protein
LGKDNRRNLGFLRPFMDQTIYGHDPADQDPVLSEGLKTVLRARRLAGTPISIDSGDGFPVKPDQPGADIGPVFWVLQRGLISPCFYRGRTEDKPIDGEEETKEKQGLPFHGNNLGIVICPRGKSSEFKDMQGGG